VTVLFDRRSGRLRLDKRAADALVAWARGTASGCQALTELHEAGVITRGRPHAALVPAVEALSEPVCRVQVSFTTHGEDQSGSGWVMSDAAALLLDLPDGLRELVTVHPTFLPAGLARVVRLGPRPRVEAEPLHLPSSLLGTLLGGDDVARRAAADGISRDIADSHARTAIRSLASGSVAHWSVGVSWRAARDRPGERRLSVLDTPDAGLWLLEPVHELTALWPSTPTAVWRALTVLLPGDDEIAASANLGR